MIRESCTYKLGFGVYSKTLKAIHSRQSIDKQKEITISGIKLIEVLGLAISTR